MKQIRPSGLCLLILAPLVAACSTTAETPARIARPENRLQTGAVIAGDYPDPSVIRVESTYWAVATSSAWAPEYPILRSQDLANWEVAGAVFSKRPQWSEGNYWAPEIAQLGERFYVYYSAKKKNGGMCIAVASAVRPEGPYRDHGPLTCEAVGSIDAMPVIDDKGEKYLFWKEDGNSQKKPTPIHVQKLSRDGTRLVGTKKEAIRNTEAWEGALVEGPFVMKRGDHWYMFYSGNGCCGLNCSYALGVARSKSLFGPWQKNPKNPILKSNANWKCPGHGSIVSTGARDVLLYHAYHHRDFIYVGRQALADPVHWQNDGWPTINDGLGPAVGAVVAGIGAAPKNAEHFFIDEFRSKSLIRGWQWPSSNVPRASLRPDEGGRLILTAPATTKPGDPAAAVIARSTTTGDYVATAVLRTESLQPGALAGLSVFGETANAFGVAFGNGKLTLWRRQKGKNESVATAEAPKSAGLHLRITAREGKRFQFETSHDGVSWTKLGPEMDGSYLPPWDLGIRIALTSGGRRLSAAEFDSFTLRPLAEPSRD